MLVSKKQPSGKTAVFDPTSKSVSLSSKDVEPKSHEHSKKPDYENHLTGRKTSSTNELAERIAKYEEARKLLQRHYINQGNKYTSDQMNHLEEINHQLPYMRTELENLYAKHSEIHRKKSVIVSKYNDANQRLESYKKQVHHADYHNGLRQKINSYNKARDAYKKEFGMYPIGNKNY